MLKWIADNKQWLFSGIGVTALVGIGHLGWRLVRKMREVPRTPAATTPSASASGTRTPTLPSGNDIAITVDKAPPYQWEQTGRNYVGLQVSWPIIFWGIVPLKDGTCIVNFAYGDKTWGAKIGVRVKIDDYPRLKTAPRPNSEDTRSIVHGWIEGKITRVSTGGMDITPTKIEFFD